MKSVVEGICTGAHAVLRQRPGFVLRFVCLLLSGAVTACAAEGGADAADAGAGARQVKVACVTTARRGESPCAENAVRACGGPATLRTVTLNAAIPVTEGVDQHPAPMYQYSAVYTCGTDTGK
ncbi:hypothetical protein [Burkholderia sp. Ac-20353]|uniref:hypothetical protein n=1 Tax=Burkholderia sp. Ac-20353 TaxID=2703894 RepID=UPI00197B8D71|nr:hypothetical protein [Burkholderia sp. Ac-20353]MBN3785304.1 hypothetical protein [Burkholderia sp. Ac-20353]